jgi:mono/diheme cytochrome c family protein
MKVSWISRCCIALLSGLVIVSCTSSTPPASNGGEIQVARGSIEQVRLGRQVVLSHACAGCHGGFDNPAGKGFLAGLMSPTEPFYVGACTVSNPTAQPCYITRPRNLTPDNATGLGRFSERQIFNSLRYGLRPEDTPDVDITSTTPGQGNFPEHPHYLAPPMPWPSWRNMTDQELWAIAAYLKHGVKPVTNKVEDSEGPPDFWAALYIRRDIGPYPAASFPTANEEFH